MFSPNSEGIQNFETSADDFAQALGIIWRVGLAWIGLERELAGKSEDEYP